MEGVTKAFKKTIEFISTHKMPILAMASIVVCITTYSLILPALTLTKDKAQEQGGISLTNITEEAESNSDTAENSDSQEEDKDADSDKESVVEDSDLQVNEIKDEQEE